MVVREECPEGGGGRVHAGAVATSTLSDPSSQPPPQTASARSTLSEPQTTQTGSELPPLLAQQHRHDDDPQQAHHHERARSHQQFAPRGAETSEKETPGWHQTAAAGTLDPLASTMAMAATTLAPTPEVNTLDDSDPVGLGAAGSDAGDAVDEGGDAGERDHRDGGDGGDGGDEGWGQGAIGGWGTFDDDGDDNDDGIGGGNGGWGGSPGTQGFGSLGWGATQQFKDFAPQAPPRPAPAAPLAPSAPSAPACPPDSTACTNPAALPPASAPLDAAKITQAPDGRAAAARESVPLPPPVPLFTSALRALQHTPPPVDPPMGVTTSPPLPLTKSHSLAPSPSQHQQRQQQPNGRVRRLRRKRSVEAAQEAEAAEAYRMNEDEGVSPSKGPSEHPTCYPVSQHVQHVVKLKRLPPPPNSNNVDAKDKGRVVTAPALPAAITTCSPATALHADDAFDPDFDMSGGTQPEPEEPEPEPGVELEVEPRQLEGGCGVATQGTVDTVTWAAREGPSVRPATGATAGAPTRATRAGARAATDRHPTLYCPSCGREVMAGSSGIDGGGGSGGAAHVTHGTKRRRLDLSYLHTLLEANAAAGTLAPRAAAAATSPDARPPLVFVMPREDTFAARNLCAKPVPVPTPMTSGGEPDDSSSGSGSVSGVIPAPNW